MAQNAGNEDIAQLTPPALQRTSYWINQQLWPGRLRADVHAVLERLQNPNLFAGRRVRKLSANTVKQYGHMIRTLVSAQVHSGVALENLQCLADTLAPDHVSKALGFLANRGGGKITATMLHMMLKVRVLADMSGLPADQRDELEEIWFNVEANAPSSLNRRQMAGKNRVLLEQLEHDQRFADLIHTLPQRLAHEARTSKHPAETMRTALAIDLLLICSMRRENLIRLELGTSIRKVDGRWIIEIAAEDLKNDQPLRFKLEGESVLLLEDYIAHWRPALSDTPNPWLFPGPDGKVIKAFTMTTAIQAHTKRVLGVAISPHQFRHISAETFLLANLDKLDMMSDHLGHRDRNTTRNYYARSKQKQASRAYQEHVLKARAQASVRLVIRRRRSTRKGGET